MTDTKKPDEQVDVDFGSHPPIEEDLDGVATLLRQTLLQFVDCNQLANHLIHLKNITQVIALESPEEEDTSDEDEEPDNDIYGTVSVIDLPVTDKTNDTNQLESRKQLLKYLREKCPKLNEMLESKTNDESLKVGMVVNERYINLPPQMALPTLKNLTQSLDESHFTHLIFVAKILLRSRATDTKLPSKKSKAGHASSAQNAEPLVFVNPEEEIISEGAEFHTDIDVSAHCDENATWSFSSDVKYIPHRRILLINYDKWPEIMKNLEKELKQ